jgi:hypothetical protein
MRTIRLTRAAAVATSIAGFLAVAAFPATGSGAVTFGSDLTAEPNAGVGCLVASPCTVAQTAPSAQFASPIEGVVVRWRIKTDGDGAGSAVSFRVLHPAAALGAFIGAGISTSIAMPAIAGVYPFDTRLPIHIGDRIGIDAPLDDLNVSPGPVAGRTLATWGPTLAEGGAGTVPNGPGPGADDWELLVNADVEPDGDKDGFGDETQDACPTNASTQGACPTTPASKKKCKKGFRLKKFKTKSGKRKKKCVRKKKGKK